MTTLPPRDASCPLCRGTGVFVGRAGELAHATRCSCVGPCPECRDTGWVVASGEGRTARRRRCECLGLDDRIAKFDAAHIPARHSDSTFKSFEHTGELTRTFMRVYEWCREYQPGRPENRGLVLYGDPGRGKTHLMIAALREIILRHGVSVRFVEFSHLLSELKSGFDAGRGAAELLNPLVAVDVLAIDELGKGRNTEFEQQVIDELVSRRYNAMVPILATTNHPPGESTGRPVGNAAAADPRGTLPPLIDRIGLRVYSRLRETTDFVGLAGRDYRELISQRRGRTS